MGEPSRKPSQNPTTHLPITQDIFIDIEPSPKPEDLSLSSTIPPGQTTPTNAVSWSTQIQKQKKKPSDYESDRVNKYAKYFRENEILPIPELVQAVEPKTLSFVVTDIKTRRLASLNKEKFEETLKSAGIPGKYICRRSFATWDVLLPTEELAKKLATNNIKTKYFRLQPEYLGKRHIKVTVCNASMQLNGDVLAAYLSTYGGVEEYTLITSAHGTAYGDYVFTMILDRGGFHSIPHTITYRDTTMMVVVEGRKPLCWNCKKLGHFSRSCPQKTTITGPKTTSTTSDTINAKTTTTTTTTTTDTASTNSNPETGVQPEKEEGWTLAKGNKKKSSPTKPTTTITTTIAAAPATTQTPNKKKTKNQQEEMETTFNLKRRRDSGDSDKDGEKKQCKNLPTTPKPKKQQPQPEKQPLPIQPQKPTEKTPRPTPIIQNNPQRPAHIPHSPAQHTPKESPLLPTLPSLSPITTPKIFSRSRSVNRIGPSPSSSPTHTRTHSETNQIRKPLIGITLCKEPDPSKITDHQLKTLLKPLFSFKSINEKNISNPYLFRDATKVTTFVRTAGNRTRELWRFIQEASCADLRLAELDHSSLKKMLPFCSGRVPILVHPSFYRSLKLRYPMDVGGITRDDRVSTELGTGSLRQAVGILTPKDFRPVVDTE